MEYLKNQQRNRFYVDLLARARAVGEINQNQNQKKRIQSSRRLVREVGNQVAETCSSAENQLKIEKNQIEFENEKLRAILHAMTRNHEKLLELASKLSNADKNSPESDGCAAALTTRTWLTIREAAQIFPFSEKSLRHLVASAEAYARHPKAGLRSNGFAACVVRPAGQRRLLINRKALEAWIADGQVGGQK